MGLKPNYSFLDKKLYNLSNHLYMGVIAMGRMNAEEEEIEKFSNYYLNVKPLEKAKKKFDPDFIN